MVSGPQLAEQLLLTPEVQGSNPVIGKNLHTHVFTVTCYKNENKEKDTRNGPFKSKMISWKMGQICNFKRFEKFRYLLRGIH